MTEVPNPTVAELARGLKRGLMDHRNQIAPGDRIVHDWYRFVLAYPPHLVRDYLGRFGLDRESVVLDPFAGTGTTLVEAGRMGFESVGIEANEMAMFACFAKTFRWWAEVDDQKFGEAIEMVADGAGDTIVREAGVRCRHLEPDQNDLLLAGSISRIPLHKCLVLKEWVEKLRHPYDVYGNLALAKIMVKDASNLRFGPEVGVSKKAKQDAPVLEAWVAQMKQIRDDLAKSWVVPATGIWTGDARAMGGTSLCVLRGNRYEPMKIDAVFTSPPYPNEKDYTRTTRLESVVLGFVESKAKLREMKQTFLRSNTRGIYQGDDDDQWVKDIVEIQDIANEIERRRIEMGKTSGFEKLYARAVRLYFGGMTRHLMELRKYLRPGANLGYVVGDQASYLQVLIPTGKLLATIADRLGYQVEGIDLFGIRGSRSVHGTLREEVVRLRWPGVTR